MIRRITLIICVLLLVVLGLPHLQFTLGTPASAPLQLDLLNGDRPQGKALVALQTALTERHYQSSEHYQQQLDRWLGELRAALPDAQLLVVLPEHTGTWLAAADEGALTYLMPSTGLALVWPALRQPLTFVHYLRQSDEPDAVAAALFRLKADAMAASYHAVMSGLAAKHGITLAAGSLVLPAPSVQQGRLIAGAGPLRNVAVLYGPGGSLLGLSEKRFPVLAEQGFVTGADTAFTPIKTPFGPVALMVCADSWYPTRWAGVSETELVLVTSWLAGADSWQQPWRGYNGFPAPSDVDPADAGRLTEAQAWVRYALPGRGGARAGINVFGRDRLWDQAASGRALAISGGQHWLGAEQTGPVASVLWIHTND